MSEKKAMGQDEILYYIEYGWPCTCGHSHESTTVCKGTYCDGDPCMCHNYEWNEDALGYVPVPAGRAR